MRWRIVDSNNRQEQAERAEIIARIDLWWQQFEKDCNEIGASFSRNSQAKFAKSGTLADWMHQHLNSIDANLMWEFGPAIKEKGHRLVITPESSRHLRPLVTTILHRAPKIPGWEFYQYRLPEDIEMAHRTVASRAGLDSSDFKARIARGENSQIDICYFSPSVTEEGDQRSLNAVFVATETLLGEEYLDKWVGAIEVKPLKKSSALRTLLGRNEEQAIHLIPLERLKETFEAVVQSVREQLPPEPHFVWLQENTPYSLAELNPSEADDYPARSDLFVAVTANVTMWQAAHNSVAFYSERFSRCHESFCYLKIYGADGLEGCEFTDRGEIEDAINEVLKPARLGCVIGGGTGKLYSYCDLALTDVPASIRAIRMRLRAGRVPKRSWIQFFDADYAQEWVGIYDDTPAPPMNSPDA